MLKEKRRTQRDNFYNREVAWKEEAYLTQNLKPLRLSMISIIIHKPKNHLMVQMCQGPLDVGKAPYIRVLTSYDGNACDHHTNQPDCGVKS